MSCPTCGSEVFDGNRILVDDRLLDAAKHMLVRSWREFGGSNWDEGDYYDSAVLRLLGVVQSIEPTFDPSVDESSTDSP